MKNNINCSMCIITKQITFLKKKQINDDYGYLTKVIELYEKNSDEYPAPWFYARIQELRKEIFNTKEDFKELKHKYNSLVLSLEDKITARINEASDAVLEAVKFALLGNYIDFAALKDCQEETLLKLLNEVDQNAIDIDTYTKLSKDLKETKNLVILTDNCGEIVFDKILVKTLQKHYPLLNVICVLRGEDTINDATLDDAKEIGLDKICHCIGNGTPYPGTIISELSKEAKQIIDQADLIISKGQGNFEGLYKSNLNIYYLFLVKCDYFVKLLKMPKLSIFFKKEEDVKTYL